MSDSTSEVQEIIDQFIGERMAHSIFAAALALTVYDLLLSFSQELECIWHRKLSAAKVLYFVIRYTTILSVLWNILIREPMFSSLSASTMIYFIVTIICLVSYAAFDCLRIWALYKLNWVPLIVVFVFSMFNPAMSIYYFSVPYEYSIESLGCWANQVTPVYTYLGVITRAVAVGSDAIVLVFTLAVTLSNYRESKKINVDTKLTTTLVENGSVQFLILLMMNIIAMFLNVFSIASSSPTVPHLTYFITLLDAIHSILISNFLLGLRSVNPPTGDLSELGQQSSSVRFADSMLGNIGASLDNTWALNVDDFEEEYPNNFDRNNSDIADESLVNNYDSGRSEELEVTAA